MLSAGRDCPSCKTALIWQTWADVPSASCLRVTSPCKRWPQMAHISLLAFLRSLRLGLSLEWSYMWPLKRTRDWGLRLANGETTDATDTHSEIFPFFFSPEDQSSELCEVLTLICPEENKTPNKSDFATVWNLGQEKINQFLESVIRYKNLKCHELFSKFFFFFSRFICFMFAMSTSYIPFHSVYPSIHPFSI